MNNNEYIEKLEAAVLDLFDRELQLSKERWIELANLYVIVNKNYDEKHNIEEKI
jgi:hypothetical protein